MRNKYSSVCFRKLEDFLRCSVLLVDGDRVVIPLCDLHKYIDSIREVSVIIESVPCTPSDERALETTLDVAIRTFETYGIPWDVS